MTRPITCDCEEFDRDLATDRCHCGHAYDQHSEDDDLVCTATAPPLVGCARCGQPLRDDNCPDECDCEPAAASPARPAEDVG
jgi:hypothetical protein